MRTLRVGRAVRIAWQVIAWVVLAASVPTALAQSEVRAEVEVASGAALVARGPLTPTIVGVTVRAHVAAAWDLGPVELRATLDPIARVDGTVPASASFEPGLTEALLAVPLEAAELQVGLLLHPVQTARLSVPVRLEATNGAGAPEGLLGAGATIYFDAWRVRPAALYRVRDGAWGGGASVRRDMRVFDLEAHLYWLDRLAVGLGASGLANDVVLYGEAWLVSDPWAVRGAVGSSGFAGPALWTVEAAYAPLGTGPTHGPQLLGQIDMPLDADTGIALDARLAWAVAEGAATAGADLHSRGTVRLYRAEPEATASIAASVDHTGHATTYALRVSLTAYH